MATEEEIGGNKPFPLTVIGWSSRKLTRICRSTQQPKRRRTAIEIKMACERMTAAGGVLKWCNSHQQLADGVTKVSANWQWSFDAACTAFDMTLREQLPRR